MASIREIKRKIGSVKQTGQVTKAMKMISASRLKKSQAALIASKPYALKVEELISNIFKRMKNENKPMPDFLKTKTGNTKLLVVFTSDKGLCGSFNNQVLRQALAYYEENKSRGINTKFVAVGKKGRDFFASKGFDIWKEYIGFIKQPSFTQAEILISDILPYYFEDKNVCAVDSLYTEFKSMLRQKPNVRKIMPLGMDESDSEDQKSPKGFDYKYEPEQEKILTELLPRALKTRIYYQILESFTSEQASRMNVMENATRNAEELIEVLTLEGNKIRQASITREILEVVSGAEVLV
ncbi:ATP synthase F1 subunit gamma [Elusimicrobiota bacterium]